MALRTEYLLKQRPAARVDLGIRDIEPVIVPGIGDVVCGAQVFLELVQLAAGIAAQDAQRVAHVHGVHADQQVIILVVASGQLARAAALAGNAVAGQLCARGRIDRVADLLPAGRAGGDGEAVLQVPFAHELLHDHLAHRAAADVAVADKENP